MNEVGVDISGQHAKDVAEALKEHFFWVVTVCELPRSGFRYGPLLATFSTGACSIPRLLTDPLEHKREVFRQVRDEIKENVRNFAMQTLVELHAGS